MQYPKVSILIPNFNGEKFLEKCLPSIYKNVYQNFEVILIDNNSTDDSVEFITKNFSKVKLVVCDSNLGYSKALNKGAKYAQGEYFLFLDNDTKVDKNWLLELVSTITSQQNAGLCTSQIIDTGTKSSFVRGGIIDRNGFFSPQFANCLDDNNESREVHFGITSWLVSKKAFYEAGQFDEKYKFFCDDVDLSWRIRLCGYKNFYVPKSIVYHYKIAKDSKKISFKELYRRRYIFEKDYLKTLLKNLDKKTLPKSITKYLFYKLLILPLDLLVLDFSAPAGLYGMIKAFKNYKKQQSLFKNRKISDQELLKNSPHRLLPYQLRTSPKALRNPFKR